MDECILAADQIRGAILKKRIAVIVLTFSFLFSVPTSDAASNRAVLGPAPSQADYEQVSAGFLAAHEGRCDDVLASLPAAVAADTFSELPEFVRRGALKYIFDCVVELDNWDTTAPYLDQLVDMPDEETLRLLRELVLLGERTEKPQISVYALHHLSKIGGAEVRHIRLPTLKRIYYDINRLDSGEELRYAFLRIVYESQYTTPNPFFKPEWFMIEYARMAADRGDTDDLRDIVLGLSSPGIIFQVRIDRRFDAIRQDGSLESFLDLEAAVEREITRLGLMVDRYPNMLRGYIEYSEALIVARKYEEALAVIEPVALRVRTPGEKESFIDADREANWTIEQYAYALDRVRYHEQSDALRRESAEMLEHNQQNVSQRINYASWKLDDGEFEEVLATLDRVRPENTSDYGRMWANQLAVCAITMGDSKRDYSESLAYLIGHERDNPRALIKVYLCLDNLSAAANALIRRLRSTDQRIDALTSLQYSTGDKSAHDNLGSDLQTHLARDDLTIGHELDHRFDALRDRPDVREAANAVGRIEEVSLSTRAWLQ